LKNMYWQNSNWI